MGSEYRGWADTSGGPAVIKPVTYKQEEWLWALNDGRSNSSVAYVWDLRGQVDLEALREALQRLVNRHESLRTTFRRGPRSVHQVVWPAAKVQLPIEDLAGGVAVEVERLVLEEADAWLDLTGSKALWRGFLIRLQPTSYVLALVGHHALLDGASKGVLHQELAALYRAVVSGSSERQAATPAQLADFARWQRRPLAAAERTYWRDALGDRRRGLALPGAERTGRFRLEPLDLPTIEPRAVRALERVAAPIGASLGTALRAIAAAVFTPYTSDGVVLGVVHANRREPRFAGLIGELADELPVRVDVAGDPSFPALVQRAHEAWLEACRHPAPLGAIVAAVGGRAGVGHGLAYDLAVNWFPAGVAEPPVELPGIDGSVVTMTARPWIDGQSGEFDREFHGGAGLGVNLFADDGGGVSGHLWTRTPGIPPATAAALARAFGEIANVAAAGSPESLQTLLERTAAW